MQGGAVRCLLIVFALITGGAITATAKSLPRSVLVITESSPYSSGAIAMSVALGSETNVNLSSRIAVYTEHLDLNRFPSPRHRELVRSYLHDKYRETPIGVVLVDGLAALDLALSWRSDMGSQIPVVFYNIDKVSAAQLKLPPNVTGLVAQPTFRGMVDAARILVPGLKRVVLVGDPVERDPYRRNYKQEIAALPPALEVIDLTGLAVAEVKERLAALPNDAVVLYTALFVDGAGVVYTPQTALLAISRVTSRPIFIDAESQMGYGAVGGFVFSFSSAARHAAQIAMRILNGENVSQIPVANIDLNEPIFDWRELKRWNIGEDRLPPGSEIRFRELTAWERYRWQITAIAAALLAQSLLIASLFFERHRRRRAEVEVRQRMGQLALMNRRVVAGELSASIAHEINQPLAAIVASSNAAIRWLGKKTPNIEEAVDSLKRIESDGHRASHVIENVKMMFKKDTAERTRTDINELIGEVFTLMHVELEKSSIEAKSGLTSGLPQVSIDRIQIQQVLLNLARNAVEAMSLVTDRPAVLRIRSALTEAGEVVISVEDSGPGIGPENMDRIFEPFFTTKPKGMGMGLSICRSIVEAHGGHLNVAPRGLYGSVFTLVLPLPR
jgi:signal transduction histidine kinase